MTGGEMRAARDPRLDPRGERLLVLDPESQRLDERHVSDLPSVLAPGDLLVVNDAGTCTASLALRTGAGCEIEARILSSSDGATAEAILFGAGDWRTDTDLRPAPPPVAPGEVLTVAGAGVAVVVGVSAHSPCWVELRLDRALADRLWSAGTPVQYRYLARPLSLAEVQTPYASRPWAAEMPSAGRALTVGLLIDLKRRGVELARLTLAIGLSSTGDAALDRLLPLPERYEIPAATAAAVLRARARRARVVAVGTSTARALETAGSSGELRAGRGMASLVIGPEFRPRIADAILSGMHERGTSHDAVLRAFALAALVDRAIEHGRARGMLVHEFGDHCLVLPRALPARRRAARARAALVLGLGLLALSSGCRGPELVPRSLEEAELDRLSRAVSGDLAPACGSCHRSSLPTANPRALRIFDLDDAAWTSALTGDATRGIAARLPRSLDAAARQRALRLLEAALYAKGAP